MQIVHLTALEHIVALPEGVSQSRFNIDYFGFRLRVQLLQYMRNGLCRLLSFGELPWHKRGELIIGKRRFTGKTLIGFLAYQSAATKHLPIRTHFALYSRINGINIGFIVIYCFIDKDFVCKAVVLYLRPRINMVNIKATVTVHQLAEGYFLTRIHTFAELNIIEIKLVTSELWLVFITQLFTQGIEIRAEFFGFLFTVFV